MRNSLGVFGSVVAIILTSSAAARAQVNIRPNQSPVGGVGAGVGVGVGLPYGYPFGYFGYYPGAYSSSWSNGFSLYGPPVPTYGSVIGAFGGSDQRLNNFSNIYMYNGDSIGLGQSGAGGAGPRRRHYYSGGETAGLASSPTAAPANGNATIEVRVPNASAEVFFESINTRQQGVKRVFLSPPLQAGTTYYYQIKAKWRDGETMVERTKSVGIRANESAVVDFTADEASPSKPLIGADG